MVPCSNFILCLFEGIQVFLDKTNIVNIYSAESTRIFLRLPTFYCLLTYLEKFPKFLDPEMKCFQSYDTQNSQQAC